ncbi:MAG TPA: hypothetical protein VK824_05060 [Planctomycetota bacterium]|nr:hypothetical protein [Planctomycetota bacterium]
MRASAAALALLALLPACGIASREAQLRSQLRPDTSAEEFAAIRGADPLVWQTWAASASTAPSPEEALAIIERGLRCFQGQPDLTWMRLSLLAQLGRRQDELSGATDALGRGASGQLVSELLTFRLDARLGAGDARAAEAEALALGSVTLDDPRAASSAWASIALAHELNGDAAAADQALDRSLASGSRGLTELHQRAGADRTRLAAAGALLQRADGRHPGHPDVRVQLAVQAMLEADFDTTRSVLDALPAPLPARLLPDVEALRARLDVVQGHVDAALERLRPRLDAWPAESGSLAVLLECWRLHGQPGDEEMTARVHAALGRVSDPALQQVLEAVAQELARRAAAPPAPAPGPEPAPIPEPVPIPATGPGL